MALLTRSELNQAYGYNNPMTSISPSEIENMRKRLLDNISDLNKNKSRMKPDEYFQLSNYHHYALTILDNMIIVQKAEMSDPHNRSARNIVGAHPNIEPINPYETGLKVVYGRDGKARMVSSIPQDRYRAEWEKQFDENVLNPPCYQIPPANVWGLPQ